MLLSHLMPATPAMVNVPVIAVIRHRYQVSVIAPATRVAHVPPTAVIGPSVALVVAPAKFEAAADSSTAVTVVPAANVCSTPYSHCPADTAPSCTPAPTVPVPDTACLIATT